LGAVSWGRLQTLLEAAIDQADPIGAEQQASAAARERFVRLGRATEHGLKVIIARATAGAIWFTATIDRIVDILARHGDTDTVAVRRSKAIGILAQPAETLQLLCQHQDDDSDGAAEPTDPDQKPAEAEDEINLEEAEQDAEATVVPDQTAMVDRQRPISNTADESAHQSLQLTSRPFDPERARPRAVVTHAGWQVRQPEPGTWLWRSPPPPDLPRQRQRHPPTRRHRIRPS
jgi:hypothetical protein